MTLSVSGTGTQSLEHVGELFIRIDEDEQVQRRKLLQAKEIGSRDRGAAGLRRPGVQVQVVDDRQSLRRVGGELGDRIGGADRVHMGEPLRIEFRCSRSRIVQDQSGVDEARGEEVLTEVDRLRVQGPGRFIGTDE